MTDCKQREYYLDKLKVFLTLLVIFHHSAAGFGGAHCGWAYQPSLDEYAGDWVGNFLSVNFSYFMPLFFFISGYFVPASFDKAGAVTFIEKKLLRLGVPMLFITASLSVFVGRLEVGHGWFLQHLLLFCLVYAVIRLLFPKWRMREGKPGQPSMITLTLIFLGLAVANYFIKGAHYSDQWYMVLGFIRTEPNHYAANLLMFVLGVTAYRKQWLKNMSKTTGLSCLILGLILSAIVFLRNDIPALRFTYSHWFWYESLMCITLCFGMTYLFKTCFNKSSALLRWMSAQAFGAYVFHLIILFALEYSLDPVYIGSLKFAVLGALTTVLSFGLTWFIRLIPGLKKVL